MRSNNSWLARHRSGALYSFILVLVVAAVAGAVPGAVRFFAAPAFADAAARLDEAKGGAQRKLLFPDATSFEAKTAPSVQGLNSVYQDNNGNWVFDVTSAEGYHGDVELMVGITKDGKVAGLQVVAENETDGIGTNALTEDYFNTFKDKAATGTLTTDEAASGETHVDAVSGATFTSHAVVDCLNIAFTAYAQMGGM